MKILKASLKHIEELSKLQKKYMQHHKELDPYFTFKKNISVLWKQYAEKVLKDKNQAIFIAMQNDMIVGYLTAGIMQKAPVYKISKVGFIGDAFVLPKFRRQGVLKQLAQASFKWMKRNNIDYVEHPVAAKNKISLKAWKSYGFEENLIFLKKKL
jgi:GNAT superfamily N-acetyltransferase